MVLRSVWGKRTPVLIPFLSQQHPPWGCVAFLNEHKPVLDPIRAILLISSKVPISFELWVWFSLYSILLCRYLVFLSLLS